MNDINVENTSAARTSCEVITAGVTYYQNLVAELKNARTEITQNWEGDAADLTGTLARIDGVTVSFEEKLIPSLQNLSTTVVQFADAIDETAANDVSEGTTDTSNNSEIYGPPAPTDSNNNANDDNLFSGGFWSNIGSDFTDDWDFSDVDSLWSGIGAVGQGLLNTVGSSYNTVYRVAGGIWDFIFG